jgi:ABC-type uncharacterized transport system substrate-binding protein
MTPSFTLIANRIEAGKFALRNNLALIGYRGDWAEAGALLTYGTDGVEALKRSAGLANRILKGSRPADTPVEQITKLELVVNMSSAKSSRRDDPAAGARAREPRIGVSRSGLRACAFSRARRGLASRP